MRVKIRDRKGKGKITLGGASLENFFCSLLHAERGLALFPKSTGHSSGGVDCGGLRACVACSKP